MKTTKPLVSIMIPNRNHSRFLGACIESALNQTHSNLEIVVLDNCSDDNSVEVASRYVSKGVRVCKNPINIANKNFDLLTILTEGEYMILLCADDVIQPTFIEKCVAIMEQNLNVGYVHCERDYLDGNDIVTELDPFYNCSFICPGESVLPIYMLTDVAQPSQCVMRRRSFEKALGYNTEFDHGNADIDLWFRLSLVSDYAYLREKLALIRVHGARETLVAFRSFYHPLALYLTQHYHAELAGIQEGHQNVLERIPAAHHKLATECIQIAFSCLEENDLKLAKKYMLFAQMMSESIVDDAKYKLMSITYEMAKSGGNEWVGQTERKMFEKRIRSYDPPDGAEVIEVICYEK